jgi:hypothetical protein
MFGTLLAIAILPIVIFILFQGSIILIKTFRSHYRKISSKNSESIKELFEKKKQGSTSM